MQTAVTRTREQTDSQDFEKKLLKVGVVLCFYIAMMGDLPDLNRKVGGAPKIVSLGVVGIMLLHFFITADFKRLKRAFSYVPLLYSLVFAILMWTLIVWVMDFTEFSSVKRGLSKMLYQIIAMSNVLGACYLMGAEAVDGLFTAMVLANGSIMLYEVKAFGIGSSISSLVTCLITFGNIASGFIKELELHDITFTFGQCMIYFLHFAPRETKPQRVKRWVSLGFCLFFMLTGLKRSTFPAIAMVTIIIWFVRKQKPERRMGWIMFCGIGVFLFGFVYIWSIRSGAFVALMDLLGVDMLGRDDLWKATERYYELSPLFMGRGFEAVDGIITDMVNLGLLGKRLPFHNDYLKVFVELGFGGFAIWLGIQTIAYPIYWNRRFGSETALLYISIFMFMAVTYMTDNTAFYFWSSTALRLLPMAFSMGVVKKEEEKHRWVPPTAQSIAEDMRLVELESAKSI